MPEVTIAKIEGRARGGESEIALAVDLKVGAETYEGELEMDYLSRLSPIR
jgi:enoyl-CoA hydratase/carnithine racemase